MDDPRPVDMREMEDAPPASDAAGLRRVGLLGDIVKSATAREPGEETTTPLRCPGRGRKSDCSGRLRIRRLDVPAEIRWECVRCGHAGRITSWRNTRWDLSRRGGSAPGDEPGLELVVPQAEYDFLKSRLTLLDPLGERVLAGAGWRPEGVVLRGTWIDLEEFAGHIAFEANRTKSERALRRFEGILDRIDRVLDAAEAEEGEGPTAGDGSERGGPAGPEFPRAWIDAIREALATMPEDASDAERQAVLDRAIDAHNTRPQAELCGLSPAEVHRLLSADWEAPGGGVETNADLALEELAGSPFLDNARTFLAALREEEGTRATAAGNLNRAFVERMLESMRFSSELVDLIRRMNKVINEQDAWPLHELRVVLVRAGLVKKRKGAFTLTRRGAELLDEEAGGALYARLFRTFFRRFNLAYLDGYPEAREFQDTLAVSLHRFGEIGDWLSPRRAVSAILLPVVRQRVPPHANGFDPLPGLVRRRFLDPLVDFGLAEERIAESEEERADFPDWMPPGDRRLYRKTPLFDRFLTFRPRDGPA